MAGTVAGGVGFSGDGPVRTDMYCHHCTKNFIAQIDMSLDGQHVILCPWCDHEHCRVVKEGVVTGDRWDGRNGAPTRHDVSSASVWKAPGVAMQTGTASAFMRDRWLNRGD